MALASLRPTGYLSFLRPLALPRSSTLTRFLSTSSEASASTSTSSPTAPSQSSLEYRVSRTPSAQLPIYLLAKRGGNLKQTRVKKIEGNIAKLREDLKVALGIEEDREIQVNHLTRHIIVKVCSVFGACCWLLSSLERGKGGLNWAVRVMANIVTRDTANRKWPSFWKSTSFKKKGTHITEGVREGVKM